MANVLLFVTVEAAVENLNLIMLNNSEVIATWDVNPDFFELSSFNIMYFIKPEQQEMQNVIVNTYQISDLIPGETYTVRVTAYYRETTGSRVFPAEPTEGTVMLDKAGMLPLMVESKCEICICMCLVTCIAAAIILKIQTNHNWL